MSSTDILLINPFPKASGINEATIEPPIGLAYLAAVLERAGFNCTIIDANILKIDNTVLLDEIKKIRPQIVGISSNVVTVRSSIDLAKGAKAIFPDIPIILGGPFPTSLPLRTLELSSADAIILGEGENTLLEIMQRHRNKVHLFEGVKGVIYRNKREVITNAPRDIIENLDVLPFPSYHKLPSLLKYKSRARKKPVAGILTSRGCPFQCIYCNKNIFTDKFRQRSAENVIAEIDYLVKDLGVRQLDILDDNFSFDLERADKIFDLLIGRGYDLAINLQNGIRADQVNRNLVLKMKKAGVFKVSFGVESGDERVLEVIKKRLNLEKVIQATELMRQARVVVYGNFMLGLPGDTKESMQNTIDFAKRMNPDIANFMITIPFPGTELYEAVKERGKFLIDIDNGVSAGFYGGKVFYELNGLDKDEVLAFYRKAYRDFYFRPSKVLGIISGVKSFHEIKWLLDGVVATSSGLFKKENN